MHRVIAQSPLESIVLENDSPDMAPAMFPDHRNSPMHLPASCAELAELMQISLQQLATSSTANSCEIFGW